MAERSRRLSSPFRIASSLCIAWLAGGCASSTPLRVDPPLPPPVSSAQQDPERFHLELVEKMLTDGRAFAALAHLDAIDPERAARPSARLLRAETLRHLDRDDEAVPVYEELLDSEHGALAARGLGLVAARAGDLPVARALFEQARGLRPTDARIRNDLGYALLLSGEIEAAAGEFATAIELGDEVRAVKNLLVLLLVRGDSDAAEHLAARHRIDEEAFDRLGRRADELRTRLERGGA